MLTYHLLQFAALINANEVGIPVPGATDSKTVSRNILMPVYFWAAVVAVIVIIAAGFFYVTSNGNAQQVARAKNAILSAIIGLVVVMVAYGITTIVMNGL